MASTIVASGSILDSLDTNGWQDRVRTSGKFFRLGAKKWYLKGFTYGPFAPNSKGEFFPGDTQVRHDFKLIRSLGANTVRVYYPPPERYLDYAAEYGLKFFNDVPWEKHRCFFEDWTAQEDARRSIAAIANRFGNHPSVLAISVVNEFPNDIVRYYGRRRVEQFATELVDVVHQSAPECLATFANYPTTEFLQPQNLDFHSFNVYLHETQKLAHYLDRLQHIAGSLPLVLSEHGVDSQDVGENEQAERLSSQIRCAIAHGAAGNVVFSFTDDWFTGAHQIEEWKFGVTDPIRRPKAASAGVISAWQKRFEEDDSVQQVPLVSVVVCSYNGERTLHECLTSLSNLNYPRFEVILVDDGSTDSTPEIAALFPNVRYIRQDNMGLSSARNAGAHASSGEIIAYTDDDCAVDEDWLSYLVLGLTEQKVDAIGGPNISPPSDGWIAQCVAASPGNPSHVMLDDRRAEHVPGCNMAFRRDTLLGIGGFDPRFRQAGDDVDVCWRLLDEGKTIGFASGAMVWHHRRCTMHTYFRQQKGYGRSESLVQFKHPHRFGRYGAPSFQGVIYGDGAVGLPVLPPRIYHGRFGSAPYQSIYRQQTYGTRAWVTSLEWHVAAASLVLFGVLAPALLLIAGLMLCASLFAVVLAAIESPISRKAPWWCRPLVAFLYLAQPIVRGFHRYDCRFRNSQLPSLTSAKGSAEVRRISPSIRDCYWESSTGIGRAELLDAMVETAAKLDWAGNFCTAWESWDMALVGDGWHGILIRTATEELGWPRRFTRARAEVQPTGFAIASQILVFTWIALAICTANSVAASCGALAAILLLAVLWMSRRNCLDSTEQLIHIASGIAGFEQWTLETEHSRDRKEDESASILPAEILQRT